MNREQLIETMKKMVLRSSQRNVAEQLGVSPSYLGDVLAGRRDIGPAILKALHFTREVQYRKSAEEKKA